MLKLFTNEIFAFFAAVLFLIAGWVGLAPKGYLFCLAFSVIFVGLFLFVFASLKIYAPSIFISNGMYEDCIAYCIRALDSPFSIIKLINTSRLSNYFRIFAAHACLKIDSVDQANSLIKTIEDINVLTLQQIQLRVIRAAINVNMGRFNEALNDLTTLKTGKLLEKQVHEILYLISMCYIELGIERDRALNFSWIAYNLKKHNDNYKLNWAVAIFLYKNELTESKALMDQAMDNYESLSNLAKQRLLFYLYSFYKNSGEFHKAQEFAVKLREKFPLTFYLTQITRVTIN
jgi:hypothetical protein